jgi:D-alanyl-lipoteichoic acid acyltransferase DltB (MBOAT superfamily)
MIEFNETKKNTLSKKLLFQIGILFNISLLAYYKYMDFFIENTNILLNTNIELIHLALPLAISFFTLQQVAFLVDSYEGLVEEKDFLDYAIFVSFFPQLIAGPIVHHAEMMPQFSSKWNMLKNYKNISAGLFIFSIGLFKKVVIADQFAQWANAGFNNAQVLNLLEAWATSLSYTFQMYFDFSGYTDMAIGAALLFNIKLPQNFNSPYKATGVIDYWQRWHITLTVFIKTYVYTPILRSFTKLTFNKAMLATFLAMFVSGLWHGAAWTFIFWGSLHGIALVINHLWHKHTKYKMPKILAWVITFNFINISLVIFKASTISQAFDLLKNMFFGDIVLYHSLENSLAFLVPYGVSFSKVFEHIGGKSQTFAYLIIAFIIVLFLKNSNQIIENFKPSKLTLMYTFTIFVTAISMLTNFSEFLYFNF